MACERSVMSATAQPASRMADAAQISAARKQQGLDFSTLRIVTPTRAHACIRVAQRNSFCSS